MVTIMKNKNYNIYTMFKNFSVLLLLLITSGLMAQDEPKQEGSKENDFYRITTIPTPEDVLIEGGGVLSLPNGSMAVCTRRGDVWILENPTMSGGTGVTFRKFASGLHEPLGLAYKDGALYTAQRGELTKLIDTDGDGVADVYKTVYAWPLSTHYHEYCKSIWTW